MDPRSLCQYRARRVFPWSGLDLNTYLVRNKTTAVFRVTTNAVDLPLGLALMRGQSQGVDE